METCFLFESLPFSDAGAQIQTTIEFIWYNRAKKKHLIGHHKYFE